MDEQNDTDFLSAIQKILSEVDDMELENFLKESWSKIALKDSTSYQKAIAGAISVISQKEEKATATKIIRTIKQDKDYTPSPKQFEKLKENLNVIDNVIDKFNVSPEYFKTFSYFCYLSEKLTESDLKVIECLYKAITISTVNEFEISYTELYKKCDITTRSQINRFPEKYRKALNRFKSSGIISDFSENECGIKIRKNY